MKSNDNVGITFANILLGAGILNGVVNMQLGAFQFSENAEGKIDPDPAVCCRLRMDIPCAEQVVEVLSRIIEDAKKHPVASESTATDQSHEKMN